MSEAHAAPDAAPATARSLSKIEIIGFLIVVIAAQVVLAFMFIPKSSSSAATPTATETPHAKDADKGEKKSDLAHGHGPAPVAAPQGEGAHDDLDEVNLGKFSLTSFDPRANVTLLIEFHLYGTVAAEHKEHAEAGGHGGHGDAKGPISDEPDPESQFGKIYKRSKHRFRDQVIKIIRNAEMGDLTDPGLALIKRQILAKTNALLGDPLLKEIVFSDFVVVEQ